MFRLQYERYSLGCGIMSICTTKEEKINQFLALIKDPDIQPVFKLIIENVLATSELKILKRLAALEQVLGPVSYTHLRAHETDSYLVCRLLLEKKKKTRGSANK